MSNEGKYNIDLSGASIEAAQFGDGNTQYIGRATPHEALEDGAERAHPGEETFPVLLNQLMHEKLGPEATAGKLVKLVYKQFALNPSDLPRSTVGNWLNANKNIEPRDWWTVGVLGAVLCEDEDDADWLLESAGHVTIAEKRSQRERGMMAGDMLADRVEEEVLDYWNDHSFRSVMSD